MGSWAKGYGGYVKRKARGRQENCFQNMVSIEIIGKARGSFTFEITY
jgi:hypothetical protein